MKAKPIPTSPKNHPKRRADVINKEDWSRIEKPTKRRGYIFSVVVLGIIFGFIAGFVASLSQDYVVEKVPFLKNLVLESEPFTGEVIIKNESDSVREREERIENIINNSKNSVVAIYLKNAGLELSALNSYFDNEMVGNGVVVTKDGYIVIPKDLIDSMDNYIVVTSDNKVHDITHHYHDPAAHLSFIKISVDNLPSSDFVKMSEVKVGEEIFVLNANQELLPIFIQTVDTLESSLVTKVLSSDLVNNVFKTSTILDEEFVGSPVYNYMGQIVGLNLGNDKSLFPGELVSEVTNNLLNNKEIVRPYLGVNYINLESVAGLSDKFSQNLIKGALLYGDSTLGVSAVVGDSPADLASLSEGDIIMKINDVEIDKSNDLSTILANISPQQEITLVVLKSGVETNEIITLETL